MEGDVGEPVKKTYTGSCHCGAITFEVRADLNQVLRCNCSICTKKGILHLIVPKADFTLFTGAASLETYTFGTHVAQHRFCRICGIHAFYTPRSHPDAVDVNVRCLDDVDLDALSLIHFDGQNWEAAMAGLRQEEAKP
jgi:hypothetical protein